MGNISIRLVECLVGFLIAVVLIGTVFYEKTMSVKNVEFRYVEF